MKKLADEVYSKYKTRNPYEIAKINDIVIVAEPLGTIHGYYDNRFKNLIHINDSLPVDLRRYVVAALLYHGVLLPEETIVLKEKFHENLSNHEKKLHQFAFYLLNEQS